MASLALVVALILLSVLIIGPISYILSLFVWMPKLIKWMLAIICVGIGCWACFIPIPTFRILGLIDIAIGLKIIAATSKKKSEA